MKAPVLGKCMTSACMHRHMLVCRCAPERAFGSARTQNSHTRAHTPSHSTAHYFVHEAAAQLLSGACVQSAWPEQTG
eukprot:1157409-Pelagomonas_calceolata.AAC.13